jgi:hypothetical protein
VVVLYNQVFASVFGSVVAIVFQSVFHLKMHQNNFFFKKLFLTLAHQNDMKISKKILIRRKVKNKKNLNYFESAFKM